MPGADEVDDAVPQHVEEKSQNSSKKKEGEELINIVSKADPILAGIYDLLSQVRGSIVLQDQVAAQGLPLSAIPYGPNTFKFTTRDQVDACFRIVPTDNVGHAHVVVTPAYGATFDSMDGLLQNVLKAFGEMLSDSLKLMNKPEDIRLENFIVNPENVGIPYLYLRTLNVNPRDLFDIVNRICSYTVDENFNFCRFKIFERVDLSQVRRSFFDLSRNEMRNTRDLIERAYLLQLNGSPPSTFPVALREEDLLEIGPLPNLLVNFWDQIPFSIHFSSMLTMSMNEPDVTFPAKPPSSMNVLVAASISRANSATEITSLSLNSSMKREVALFIATLIFPGAVRLNVSFDEYDESASYIRQAAACGAKMLLSYHETEARWCSVTEAGVIAVETELVRAATLSGIITPNHSAARFPMGAWDGERGARNPWAGLRTGPNGEGWRESGQMRYAADDPASLYHGVARRQLFVCNIDDVNTPENAKLAASYNWQTGRYVRLYMNALLVGSQRSLYQSLSGLFPSLIGDVFAFFLNMNDYNRRYWGTSFRPSEVRVAQMYPDESETYATGCIGAKTILWLLKSLSGATSMIRKTDFFSQIKSEMGLLMDLLLYRARFTLFIRTLTLYQLSRTDWQTSEIIRLCLEKGSLLEKIVGAILDVSASSRIARNLGDFVENSYVWVPLAQLIEIVLRNPLAYGVLPQFIRETSPEPRLRANVEALANRREPYMNIATGVLPARPIVRFAPSNVWFMLRSYTLGKELQELALNHRVLVRFPVPYEVTISSSLFDVSNPISINYSGMSTARSIRRLIKLTKLDLAVIPVNQDGLRKPDEFFLGSSAFEEFFFELSEGGSLVMSVDAWLQRLSTWCADSVSIRTKHVHFVELNARV